MKDEAWRLLTSEENQWASASMDNTKAWLVPSLQRAADRLAQARLEVGAAQLKIENLEGQLAQPEPAAREAVLVDALRGAEWVGQSDEYSQWAECPNCSQEESQGHLPDCPTVLALADTSPAAAALLAQGEPCGKCRLHALVIAEAKRHLKVVLGWVPDNDARREAARFLRLSGEPVRAALAPGEEKEWPLT